MPEYQLEIKQLVDYPRCRIYREFVQVPIADSRIRTNGGGRFFCYTVLCFYANFRTSYRRLDGISYTIYPGKWIRRVSELTKQLHFRFRRQTLNMLDTFQDADLLQYSLLGRGQLVKYRITDWRRHNTVLDYNCPCQKDIGFFFLPVNTAKELVSRGKCSELDILLDLWISAVYRDDQVQGSFDGPVAYFCNGTGSPLVSYSDLALRWGVSKPAVGRILKKFAQLKYIDLFTFPGRHGTVIYHRDYLSTMSQISDVLVDKDEVAMSFNIQMAIPEEELAPTPCVPNGEIIVSKPNSEFLTRKVLELLALQGIQCVQCRKSDYMLYPLSGDCKGVAEEAAERQRFGYRMEIFCSGKRPVYTFEFSTKPIRRG